MEIINGTGSEFFYQIGTLLLKFIKVNSSLIERLDNFQYFEGYLHLIHQWGDECSFTNNMTKHTRPQVTYMLDGDNY